MNYHKKNLNFCNKSAINKMNYNVGKIWNKLPINV